RAQLRSGAHDPHRAGDVSPEMAGRLNPRTLIPATGRLATRSITNASQDRIPDDSSSTLLDEFQNVAEVRYCPENCGNLPSDIACIASAASREFNSLTISGTERASAAASP